MSKHWYNNGTVQVFRETPPDVSYVKGMLESSKQKMREHEFTEEHRKNIGKSSIGRTPWNKGKHWDEQTRAKMSQTRKGREPWNKELTADSDERVLKNTSGAYETKVKKYGSAFHNNNMDDNHKQKISEALRGKASPLKGVPLSQETRAKISEAKMGHAVDQTTRDKLSKARKGIKVPEDQLKIRLTKQYITKKKNNSFNTSSPEEELYKELLEINKHKTILRQYKDDIRYPFYCDFYIVEDDLFIELNAHWTHGGKPYDENDVECQQRLLEWQEKAKTSQFYKQAIETWTERDVKKAQCAKEHNLNYKVIY